MIPSNIAILSKGKGIAGPWICEQCGELSQFCDVSAHLNRVFCKNEACGYTRVIDKLHMRIREADGTLWQFDNQGNKTQIRMQ